MKCERTADGHLEHIPVGVAVDLAPRGGADGDREGTQQVRYAAGFPFIECRYNDGVNRANARCFRPSASTNQSVMPAGEG